MTLASGADLNSRANIFELLNLKGQVVTVNDCPVNLFAQGFKALLGLSCAIQLITVERLVPARQRRRSCSSLTYEILRMGHKMGHVPKSGTLTGTPKN